MKNLSFVVLCVSLSVTTAFSQEVPLLTQLTQPYPVPTGVDELALLNDLQGGFYVVYTEAGRLHVLRGAGDGQLVPYEVDFYGKTITDIHSLTTNPMGPGQFGCFVGTENGAERLFFFGVNPEAAFVFYRNPLDDAHMAGEIHQVELLARDSFIVDVYYLKGGVLFSATTPFFPDGQPLLERVSLAGEYDIVGYESLKSSRKVVAGDFGWYTVQKSPTEHDTIAFRNIEGDVVERKPLGLFSSQVKVNVEELFSGNILYQTLDGASVVETVYTASGYGARSAFTAPDSVKRYFEISDVLPYAGILVCKTNGGEIAYYVHNSRSPNPDFRPLSTTPSLSIVDFIPKDAARFLMIHESQDGWYSTEFDRNTYAVSDTMIAPAGKGMMLLFPWGFSAPRLLRFDRGEGAAISMISYGSDGWVSGPTLALNSSSPFLQVDIRPETTAYLDPALLDRNLFSLSVPLGSLFWDGESGELLQINHLDRALSTTNGMLYLAVVTLAGISTYQIGETL